MYQNYKILESGKTLDKERREYFFIKVKDNQGNPRELRTQNAAEYEKKCNKGFVVFDTDSFERTQ
jgi:hypothetical protein